MNTTEWFESFLSGNQKGHGELKPEETLKRRNAIKRKSKGVSSPLNVPEYKMRGLGELLNMYSQAAGSLEMEYNNQYGGGELDEEIKRFKSAEKELKEQAEKSRVAVRKARAEAIKNKLRGLLVNLAETIELTRKQLQGEHIQLSREEQEKVEELKLRCENSRKEIAGIYEKQRQKLKDTLSQTVKDAKLKADQAKLEAQEKLKDIVRTEAEKLHKTSEYKRELDDSSQLRIGMQDRKQISQGPVVTEPMSPQDQALTTFNF